MRYVDDLLARDYIYWTFKRSIRLTSKYPEHSPKIVRLAETWVNIKLC